MHSKEIEPVKYEAHSRCFAEAAHVQKQPQEKQCSNPVPSTPDVPFYQQLSLISLSAHPTRAMGNCPMASPNARFRYSTSAKEASSWDW